MKKILLLLFLSSCATPSDNSQKVSCQGDIESCHSQAMEICAQRRFHILHAEFYGPKQLDLHFVCMKE